MTARSIMIQGTGSDVGKSLLVAGLCRLFARRGLRVRPFKAQNMSNNAAVTADGGEIGRAQWLQAKAAGVAPSVEMNPILLKPQSDRSSQLILRGKAVGVFNAREYHAQRAALLPAVLASYHQLAADADLVLVEGAGSAAEINLREGDIANMGFAHAARCPVLLVGDIDRGGVIASLVGTHTVLPAEDRAMIRGFMVNKFRGDPQLFASGMQAVGAHTGWPSLGLIPYHAALAQLPQEDSMALAMKQNHAVGAVHIVVLVTPHLANFDDIDPLANEPNLRISWCRAGEVIPADAALVILAGSKSTMADLAFIRAQGWDVDLRAHHRRGGRILGICGGFQMLGRSLSDPEGIEGAAGSVAGLGFLEMDTLFAAEKIVTPWRGNYQGYALEGYEIHCGISRGDALSHPLFAGENAPEGACSEDGRVWGSYVHGMFTSDTFRRHFLASLGAEIASDYAYEQHQQQILNDWADVLEQHLASDALLALSSPIE